MRPTMLVYSGALALLVAFAGCGGGDGYSSTPTNPSPPASGSIAINIVGDRGNQSFTPNPGSATDGMVRWRNSDALVHRIVANDGSLDTGDIAPGATSVARAAPTAGMNYHCSIHPGMVGAINAGSGPPPPCTGLYC